MIDSAVRNKSTRISITVPINVLEQVKHLIDTGSVSRFISEAVAEKVARVEQQKAFEELLNAPPMFTEIADVSEYLHSLRKEDEERDKRLGL